MSKVKIDWDVRLNSLSGFSAVTPRWPDRSGWPQQGNLVSIPCRVSRLLRLCSREKKYERQKISSLNSLSGFSAVTPMETIVSNSYGNVCIVSIPCRVSRLLRPGSPERIGGKSRRVSIPCRVSRLLRPGWNVGPYIVCTTDPSQFPVGFLGCYAYNSRYHTVQYWINGLNSLSGFSAVTPRKRPRKRFAS